MAVKKESSKIKAKTGPKPETLPPFDGSFEKAIDQALAKKRPAQGWPKSSARKAK
jgi:hypothetical protein